ncbi:MAG: ATP-binding protein [Planctomycetes bacterium]|nr:ATP-binding protein [Planctomycetota bacterium]
MSDTATLTDGAAAPAAARRATDQSLIKSLSPRVGQAVEVGAITAFVGPNNSGKTETLRDILRLAANFDPLAVDRSSEEGPQPIVLSDLNFVPKLSMERMTHGLTVIDSDSSEGMIVQGIGPDLKSPRQRAIGRELQNILYRPIMNAKSVWMSSLGDLMPLRVSYVGPDDRKRLVATTLAASPLQGPENLLQMLHYADANLHQALADAFAAAFDGIRVKLDTSEQINLTLRVANDFPADLPDPLENVRQYQKLRSIDEEGDAYQSFAAILLTMLLGQGRVILIDQPEAFLQPTQARFLGRWIAANASRLACQVFVATRDVAFLEGLSEGPSELTVLRTERQEDMTSFRSIPHDATRALARFPLFATQDAFRLLFCEGVVIAAEADDKIVFETVANRLPSSRSIGFVHAVGARNVALVTKTLRQCGLQVCSVVDLDVFQTEKDLGDLVEAASGSPLPQPWLATRERLAKHVEGWFDEASIAASANEVENFLDQIKNEDAPNSSSAATESQTATVADSSKNWAKLRDERLEWLPRELRVWVEELVEDLKRQGIFVSPKGRLERWIETGSDDRSIWMNQTMQLLHQGQCPPELQAFVADLLAYLTSARSPTRSARTGHRT